MKADMISQCECQIEGHENAVILKNMQSSESKWSFLMKLLFLLIGWMRIQIL